MSANVDAQGRRYPLHITISAAFAALLLMFGSVLIAFNYFESRRVALRSADDTIARVAHQMRASVAALYEPAQNLVDVSSMTLSADAASTDARLHSLSYFCEALRLSSTISSIFVGYANGDFFLVRRSGPAGTPIGGVEIPAGSRYTVQSIERQDETQAVEQQLLFFDEDLHLLRRSEVPWSAFDPREREWYVLAQPRKDQVISDFYTFFTTGEVGVTIARRLVSGGGVVGVDLALSDVSEGLAGLLVTPSARVAMLAPDGGVVALSDGLQKQMSGAEAGAGKIEMPHLTDLDDPLYRALSARITDGKSPGHFEMTLDGRAWMVWLATMPVRSSEEILLASLVPQDELLSGVTEVRDKSVLISFGLLALALILAVALSRHISRSLGRLARAAEQIRELRLDTPLTLRSRILEVDDLAETMGLMKDSLQQFLTISHALSAEKDFNRLLEMILDEASKVAGADAGAILLKSDDEKQLDVAILRGGAVAGSAAQPIALEDDPASAAAGIIHRTAREGATIRVDAASGEPEGALADIRTLFEREGSRIEAVLSVPLKTQKDEVIGILLLASDGRRRRKSAALREETVPYVEALSSDAAVALDNRRLIKAQKDLLESFIHVVAGAIDAKSPYTHGHCQRVPVVAKMLAEAAHESTDGKFADFGLNDDEWYELHLASWLHDCGKVTTPEYVVDKATKLETIYNRIHEIRTRFEILWRDAELEFHEALQDTDADEAALRRELEENLAALRDDFAFVAECNLGDDPMTEQRIERLQRIASRTWVRHLDDRAGLSRGEMQRRRGEPAELPALETLLSDKSEHIVPRSDGVAFENDPAGFRMDVPEQLYNHGELYNLSIPRGTLTREERFKINGHIVETIRMLGRLPFPRELRRVPEWAGNHHERLDGKGYPRRLVAADLSTPARIMAIADIFEALTAVDRPYMKPRTLSQSARIMVSMCGDGHICPDLFSLFLRSGVHLRYAEEYLRPEQVDEVDLVALLDRLEPIDTTAVKSER